MPYIKPESRPKFDHAIKELVELLDRKTLSPNFLSGELNYVVSSIVWQLFGRNMCYETANSLNGALGSIQAEFYRRHVAPYEDKKLIENGDIG